MAPAPHGPTNGSTTALASGEARPPPRASTGRERRPFQLPPRQIAVTTMAGEPIDDPAFDHEHAAAAEGTDRRPVVRAPASTPASTTPLDFDAFCRAEHASVLGLAYVLSGSSTAAEELTQDAFFDAYRRWDELGRYDKPGAWVRRAVANRAISRRRRLGVELRALARIGSRRTAWTELPAGDDEVWAAVRRLPTRQAQVIALRYVEDLPLAEVAEILDVSEGTVKTHLQRARAALADALGPHAAATPPDSMTAPPPSRSTPPRPGARP